MNVWKAAWDGGVYFLGSASESRTLATAEVRETGGWVLVRCGGELAVLGRKRLQRLRERGGET
mgnify:CR=1 FL=1